jgi:FtsH-binding integral membrane protein
VEFIVLLFLANLGLSFVAASVASNKGRTAAGFFFFSFFLSFLLAIIVLIALPPIEKVNGFTNRRCPYCQEVIQAAAIVCKHCGRDVEALPQKVYTPAEKQPRSYYFGLTLTILGALGVLVNSMALGKNDVQESNYWAIGIELLMLIGGIYLIGGFGKKFKKKKDESAN